MKIIIFTSIIALAFISCQKRKEIKEWKKREGNYVSENSYLLYQGNEDTLYISQISINSSGLICYALSGEAVNFSVFHKDENPNKSYEYKCQYSSITAIGIIPGVGTTNPQISYEEFTQGREFYLSFSDNNPTFTVINPSGTVDNLLFKKK